MEQNVIVAEMVQSNKSNNQVWHVHITGIDNPELQGFCRQPLAAMRLAFVLKQRSGFRIADSSLQALRQMHQASKQPAEESPAAEPEHMEEEKTKQRKTRRAKKEKAAQ